MTPDLSFRSLIIPRSPLFFWAPSNKGKMLGLLALFHISVSWDLVFTLSGNIAIESLKPPEILRSLNLNPENPFTRNISSKTCDPSISVKDISALGTLPLLLLDNWYFINASAPLSVSISSAIFLKMAFSSAVYSVGCFVKSSIFPSGIISIVLGSPLIFRDLALA